MTIPTTGDIRLKGSAARHGIQTEFGGAATNISMSNYKRGGALVPATTNSPPVAGKNPAGTDIQTTNSNQKFSYYFGATKVQKVKATGGTIKDSGGWRYHYFYRNASLRITVGGAVDWLVIGGGGSGAADVAGGGGGGGEMKNGTKTMAVGTYAAVIGAGGVGADGNHAPGAPGKTSSFATVTSSRGGGAGCGYAMNTNINGPTGGGASGWHPAGKGSPGGNGGAGARIGVYYYAAGGGGGMGGNGANAVITSTSTGHGGNGGPGKAWVDGVKRAGGGGGGCSIRKNFRLKTPWGVGRDGGGNGGDATLSPAALQMGTAGRANYGGGGGGSSGQNIRGAPGGSGLVAVRYKL